MVCWFYGLKNPPVGMVEIQSIGVNYFDDYPDL